MANKIEIRTRVVRLIEQSLQLARSIDELSESVDESNEIHLDKDKQQQLNELLGIQFTNKVKNAQDRLIKLTTMKENVDDKIEKVRAMAILDDWDSVIKEAEANINNSKNDQQIEITTVEQVNSYLKADDFDTMTLPERYLLYRNMWIHANELMKKHIVQHLMTDDVENAIENTVTLIEDCIDNKKYKMAWQYIKLLMGVKHTGWPGVFKLTKTGYQHIYREESTQTAYEHVTMLGEKLKSLQLAN